MNLNATMQEALSEQNLGFVVQLQYAYDELTIECPREYLIKFLGFLKKNKHFCFDTLIDLCAVDYLLFGQSDWETDFSDGHSYSRAVSVGTAQLGVTEIEHPARFAVVYHLLSTKLNHRCRVKVYLQEPVLEVPSVTVLWKGANWFEREAYDLYGILFSEHQDLRRLLTDYGFIGHPFRKDFPLSGHVEMRYDASLSRVVYEPVDIEPRVLVPKVIREDNRYLSEKKKGL